MKKFFSAAAFLTALLLTVSCSKDDSKTEPVFPDSYKGTFEVAAGTPQAHSLEGIKAKYTVSNNKMTVTLYEVSFSPMMPVKIDMIIPDIDAVLTGGTYSLSKSMVVPKVGDVDFPQYTVSNLTGTVSEKEMNLSMTIMGFPVTYKGKSGN